MVSVNAQQIYLAVRELLAEAGIEEAATDAELLFRYACGESRLQRDIVTGEESERLREAARRRTKREPIQYIFGSWPFLNLELAVGPGVLIPRPETEEVCLAAASVLCGKTSPAVLDLCAGNGALALGLQSVIPEAVVTAVEWEEDAFPWLQKNVEAFKKEHKHAPRAVRADVFTWHETLPETAFDLIVSNPPYVTQEEYEELAPELLFEPRQALVAGEGGLAFYRAIAKEYRRALKPGGYIVFEIGAKQGPAVARILVEAGYVGTGLRKDMAGHSRIAVAMRNA